MLIRLCGGGESSNPQYDKIKIGTVFLRYVLADAYDRGSVCKMDHHNLTVDFIDTEWEFDRLDVVLVHGGPFGEHLMSCQSGILKKDYRCKTKAPMETITSVEDLLDFDKWMI